MEHQMGGEGKAAASSRGKALRSKNIVKGGTTAARNHRFTSFNQRISKLTIDPVRRRRRKEVQDEDLGVSASFFRISLDRWKDLNLSEKFSKFTNEVDKLCNTLPQILHFEGTIFDALVTYIEKRDTLALEPLLDLLSNFAHDLGVRFEVYYERAITLVSSVAAKHTDPEAIEWSFTCLAWLFKYLSRLLVPDLRPTFHIMAPLLGREPQKTHTTRFAAEAMSFLLRKAATVYHKDESPLRLILGAIKEDISTYDTFERKASHADLYRNGISTLLLNSMKGIERKLHTCSDALYRCIIDLSRRDNRLDQAFGDIIYGVSVALLHHTDATGFQPLLEIILRSIDNLTPTSNSKEISINARLLFISSTVRQGSRIKDWSPILDGTLKLLACCRVEDEASIIETYKAAAVILQASPLDVVLPRFRTAMKTAERENSQAFFLPFCNYFYDLGHERFQSLLFPYFQNFIVSRWKGHETELCVTLPRLDSVQGQNRLTCPEKWQEAIVQCFNHALVRDELIIDCFGYVDLIESVSISSTTTISIQRYLNKMVHVALQTSDGDDMRISFGLGAGLNAYLRVAEPTNEQLCEVWPRLCLKAPQYGNMLPYMEAMLDVLRRRNSNEAPNNLDQLVSVLVRNLHSSSRPLCKVSLSILQVLYQRQHGEPTDILSAALEIESSPLDLSSTRSISMQVRRLASSFQAISNHEWLPKAIVHFCFGLLSYKLASANEDAIAALKQICDSKVGEDLVSELCFSWLEQPKQDPVESGPESRQDTQTQRLTDFQCSNLARVENMIENNSNRLATAPKILQEKFNEIHCRHDLRVISAPNLALRVLAGVPRIAEKRSRRLVPFFLSWAPQGEPDYPDENPDDEDDQDTSQAQLNHTQRVQTWGFRDRKAMLALFCQFNNPAVIYRSSEVFQALQGLLTSGDVEIQKLALKAILTWKAKGLQPYQEHLFNFLDDNLFREEISTFLQVDDQDNVVETEHRPILMPILMRLLYGRIIARTGSSQMVKRKAVIQALSRLTDEYLGIFIEIALGPMKAVELLEPYDKGPGSQTKSSVHYAVNEQVLMQKFLSIRKQAGLVTMIKDMLSVLGSKLATFTPALINTLLHCMIRVHRQIRVADEVAGAESPEIQQMSLLKTIRQAGLQCLTIIFRSCPFDQLEPYIDAIFVEILRPRLDNLAIETAQAVSGTLQFISTLASSNETVSTFQAYQDGQRLLPAVIKCLEVPSAKDEVKLFVVDDILKKVVHLAGSTPDENSRAENGLQARQVLRPVIGLILEHVGSLLRKSPGKELLGATIELVSMLAPLVEESSQTQSLLEISAFLLNQPSQRVSPKSKGNLLHIIKHFLPLAGLDLSQSLQDHIFQTMSSLFAYFRDRPSRSVLSEVMTVLASKDEELNSVAKLCVDLNSFSTKRLDEPDFDLRMKAFCVINEEHFQQFSLKQWRPLLYNLLYYIKDNEELAIRTNASFGLRRFVETNVLEVGDNDSESFKLLHRVLLPALRGGVSESAEIVRAEYLGVIAHLVKFNPSWTEVSDMRPLLVEADDEASFFGNVLHIQQHRRLRALRRLAAEAQKGALRSVNVARIFSPLLEHFVFDKADDESAHNLSAEAVNTLGAMASSLEWPQFRATFRRYTGYMQSKPGLEKTVIKLLSRTIDALVECSQKVANVPFDDVDVHMDDRDAIKAKKTRLATTIPAQGKIGDDLLNNLLPPLFKFLHEKDESTVSLRVPVAVSIVKILRLLPPDKFRERLPSVLTDVCHILRSRHQESRDLTRKTLADISTLIGPSYFGFVLKELRGALARGYQLHVLSFTVHSILVATADVFRPGDLDYCLNQIVTVIMDDIFGPTGQEKDNQEYISKMKEVKSSKSFDSMELLAKTTSVESLVHLVRPLQNLLGEKLDLRMVKKIDELLRRIGVGLQRNYRIEDQRILIFCHEIINEVYNSGGIVAETSKKEDQRLKRYLIQPGAKKAGNRGSTSSYNHKLARFALDILRMVLRKHDSLSTPSNLDAFIPIIGDALVQSDEEIQTSALRLLTTIIRVPLKSIDDSAPIYVAECVKVVKSSTTTNAERAQAAVKLVSVILRERQTVDVQETDLAYLLKRLAPDLDEPDKQGVTFNFLKAIMARKIILTELYEIMDTIAAMMVTNQTKSARDMARGSYFQFIMEYPQTRDRFSKQTSFLVKNLEYKHQEGRHSVLEAINLFFNKLGDDLAQEMFSTFFLPLVMVIINDESHKCREMAGALLKISFARADTERMKSFTNLLRAWINQQEHPLQLRVALQIYGMYLDVKGVGADQETPVLQIRLAQILRYYLKDPENADWEVLFFALQNFAKICTLSSTSAFAATADPLWVSVRQCLAFPHRWVKLSAAKLLGSYFADFARTNAQNDQTSLPLKGSGGLYLSEQEIVNTTRASLALLKVPGVGDDLATQSVRNLVFLGKIMAQTSMAWPQYQSQIRSLATGVPQIANKSESEEHEEDEDETKDIDDDDDDNDESDENEEDEINDNNPSPTTHQPAKQALTYLLLTTSRILLQTPTTTNPSSLTPQTSTLTLLATLLTNLPLPSLTQPPTLLPTILRPLNNLTDPSIPPPFTNPAFTSAYTTLRTQATETMTLLSTRLGTTRYAALMQIVSQDRRERREERRGKRKVELVAQPERAAVRKRRKGERRTEGRRRRGEEMGRVRRGL